MCHCPLCQKCHYILLIMTIYRIYNRDLFCNLHNHTTQSNIKGLNSNKGRIASSKNKKKRFQIMKLISIIFGLMQLGLFWTVSRESPVRDGIGPVNSNLQNRKSFGSGFKNLWKSSSCKHFESMRSILC